MQAPMKDAGKKIKGFPVKRKTIKVKKVVRVGKINVKGTGSKFDGVKFPVKFKSATKIKGKVKSKSISRKPNGTPTEYKPFMM